MPSLSGFSPVQRRALAALAQGEAVFLPGRGGWVVGELGPIIKDVTMRALERERGAVLIVMRGGKERARLSDRGRWVLPAVLASQQSNQPEVQR
jgi:hypothetical protein